MNFERSIYPLTVFLADKGFLITYREQHFVRYSSDVAIITVAFANLEHLFYTHVGQESQKLVELTPIAVRDVFKDERFKFQSTLTIDNLISFLMTSGKGILAGESKVFEELSEYFDQQSKENARQINHLRNIKSADEAWVQKDYLNFINFIDRAERDLLSDAYLKKYKIAVDKSQR